MGVWQANQLRTPAAQTFPPRVPQIPRWHDSRSLQFLSITKGTALDADERFIPVKYEEVKIMPLIELAGILIVVGVLLWVVNSFIPMQSQIKSILNVVVVVAVAIWLLKVFGMWHYLASFHVGK